MTNSFEKMPMPTPEKPEKTEKEEKKKEEIVKGVELTKEQQAKIESKFAEFGIKKEDLEKIEGLKELSFGQQLLVLENLKQITLGRVQEEALTKYKEEVTKSKFLGRIWKGITKQYQIAKIEKATAAEIQRGGIETHKKVLEQLVRGSKELGLEVIETSEGELEIQYATGFENLTPEEEKIVKKFNEIASQYSKMPYEWSLKTASKKEREQFKAIFEKYEKAKEDILKIKRERDGDKAALLYLSEIDNKVRVNQFLNTHPEVEKELERITSQSAWKRVWKDIATERGLYFSAGFATRSATISLLGALGLPLAAAVVGGWITRERAKKELKEREILARRGVKDISKEAKNIVNAESLSKKIETLVNRIESTEDKKEKGKLLNSLRERLKYTQDKITAGLVNFGEKDERIKNQYDLAEKLNLGWAFFTAKEDKVISNKLGERLEKFLRFKERKISKAEKEYLRNQMIRGAVFGAAAAGTGYALRYIIGELMPVIAKTPPPERPTTEEFPLPLKEKVAEAPPPETPPETPPEAPPPEVPPPEVPPPETPPIEVPPEAPPPEAPPTEVPPTEVPTTGKVIPEVEVSGVETAQKGDSIWRMIERQLESRYGEKFTGLNEASKTYLIDAIKDKVAAAPGKFGLEDIDEIKVGQKVDFSSIFEDKTEVERFFSQAKALCQSQIESIEHNNQILKNWVAEHPGQKLTSEKVEEILTKGKAVSAVEAPAGEVSVEASPTEVPPPTAEVPSEKVSAEELARIMKSNEIENIKNIGFAYSEYEVIKDLKVGKLLDEIPENRDEAWDIFNGRVPGKEINLPHYGVYGANEFRCHLELAKFIRSFKPGAAIREMTISQFLRIVGPRGTISFK